MLSKPIQEKVPIESSSPCFRSLDTVEMDFLTDKKTRVNYQSGETVFKQGAFAPYVLYIVSGLVKVYLQTGHEKQLNIQLAKQGDFLAFSSIFDEQVYKYSGVALTDASVCMIEKNALKELLMRNPDFALQITSRNYKQENRLLDIIKDISYKQMRGKLATALLYLSNKEFENEHPFLYLSRQDIADFASIATESAIKFLKEFEKEGIIKLEGKQITVVQEDKLTEISKRG
ncbi:MAG: Crp/Fnr family transcriptional regulator [Paludibacteraceae bacterium]|nr:Crp/Fnr family transcriptional regulator [Paludibacteraceae bacterium]MBN2787187.1 Crp/Fnr family transcriptional regulator [Paludibacteraceae bacterium]